MIDISNLKKGDLVLKVGSSLQETHRTTPSQMQVTAIGPKYISAVYVDPQGEAYGSPVRFQKDTLSQVDWSQWKLFLGTRDEYQEYIEGQKQCEQLYREILQKFHRELGLAKLQAIRDIIDGD